MLHANGHANTKLPASPSATPPTLQGGGNRPAQHPARDWPPRQPAAVKHQTAGRGVAGRLGGILRWLAVVMVVGAVLTGPASATAPDIATQVTPPPVRPAPSPAKAPIPPSPSQDQPPTLSPVKPTPANRQVLVGGTTGSCTRQGTLIVHGMGTHMLPVAGDESGTFETTLTVPKATLPGAYKLELKVNCHGDPQQAAGALTVVNHAPKANDDTATTTRDMPVTIAVTANDKDDNDGYPTSVRLASRPARGTAEVQPDRTILYTPGKGFVGEDRFRYRYCDDTLRVNTAGQINAARRADPDCSTATVTVTVIDRRRPTITLVEPAFTPANKQVTVEGNTGSCNRRGRLTVVDMPDVSMAVTGDQRGTFQAVLTVPRATLPGGYKLELSVDCHGDPQHAADTLTVKNQAPVAVDATATTTQDRPVQLTVTATDPDGDDGYSTFVGLASPPAHGTATARAEGEADGGTEADGSVDISIGYTPDKGFVGSDQFKYRVCDILIIHYAYAARPSDSECSTATVTVTVHRLPTIMSVEPALTPPNRQVTVKGNTGSCTRRGTLTVVELPDLVPLLVTGDESGNFLAAAEVPGGISPSDYRLVLSVDCHGEPQQATAALRVENRAPVAVDATATTTQDTAVTITVTATDPDGDEGYPTSVEVASPPAHGTATAKADGSTKPDGSIEIIIGYTPDKGFVGQDEFKYRVCDVLPVLKVARPADPDCTTGTITVTVGRLPSISRVEPTPANRQVPVGGTTGSCTRQGTLTVLGMATPKLSVAGDESGNFEATFTVPKATLPKVYRLVLEVDCHGEPQQATGRLRVENRAPVAVDDTATTAQDTPVAIAVTANDTDPDGDDGYPTLVFEHRPPAHGTTQAQPDGTIVYTPFQGFVGQDQFQYNHCDDTYVTGQNLHAWMRLACGTATVTVTVVGDPTTTSVPPTSVPPTSVPPTSVPPTSVPPTSLPPTSVPPTSLPPTSVAPTTTRPNCVPSAGDVRSFRVDPSKGPGGAKLRVTGQADRKLAACPLRLLLGGSRLGGDVIVGPDGTISQRLPVPDDATPGVSTLRMATVGGQILAETPFEILATMAKRWWQRDPFRLLVAGGVFLLGALARAAIRRLRPTRDEPDQDPIPQHVRAKPHARPVQVALNQDTQGPPRFTIGLRPHHDAGTQTLDAGTQTLDAGTQTLDAGTQTLDAGTQTLKDVTT
jgi:hypothetical protein